MRLPATRPIRKCCGRSDCAGCPTPSYASYDQSVQNDTRAAGRVIGNAMADQVRIVRAAHPEAAFITNLWQEGAGLVQRGELTIPSDVHAVWADDGYGNLQDGGRCQQARARTITSR